MNTSNTSTWTIVEKRIEAPRVVSLVLSPDGIRPEFIAGQYVTVLLPNLLPVEGKSYSISSTPDRDTITLTVKELGVFSRALCAREVGTTLTTSRPYGFFYPDSEEPRDLAFIAGGIGITPCMSMIADLLKKDFKNEIFLFYSNKTRADIVFKNDLDTLTHDHHNFSINYFVTQEEIPDTSPRSDRGETPSPASGMLCKGRMTAEHIIAQLRDATETDIFICGSINFTKSLWTGLREHHIPSTNIYTEGFF